MFELQDFIVNWMDNNNYPPTYSKLPSQLYLPGIFCDHVKFWLRNSIIEQREFGTLIYLQRKPVAHLILGEIIRGDGVGNEVKMTPLYLRYSNLPGPCFVGSFHTHPSRAHNVLSGPSIHDFRHTYACAKSHKSIFSLVISSPLENPWFYLIIISKSTLLYNMDKTIFKAYVTAVGSHYVNTVTDSIKKEMSHYTNNLSVDQKVCQEIAHDRTLSHICTLYKAGFYSGQNGFLILRKTHPNMLINST